MDLENFERRIFKTL